MYGLGEGKEANVDSGRPKDLARTDFGVRASQSARLNVVLYQNLLVLCMTLGLGEGKVPSSVKICVVKCEKILVLVINTLNGMRLTRGKIPDVSEA
jgi:hypothetical protein